MLHGLWHKCSVMPIMLDVGHDVGLCIMLLGLWHKCSVAIIHNVG